ncbi:HAMP domain-containing histidine kinase [Anaerovorax odorimutans]|uniref:histidine kinase n=1 Tax=Anaerovorax odorimutans TaxID=109327 RepID=A0ABT1RSI6_9FIRM|nr:HAMP domain-containing sensor histidine kinase [Anaerovorax odorimutans]MCQ4638153.1 HAMP domain-containing histidine kinase [Anaerovorax odorimutans]
MKKYNLLIAASILLYVLAALAAWYGIQNTAQEKDRVYKVEINRIYDRLSDGHLPDERDLRSYKYVRNVRWLSADDMQPQEKHLAFFEEDGKLRIEIRPVFEAGKLKGYLRFEYLEPEFDSHFVLVLTQVCLGLMELFLLIVLLYLKYQLIRPFRQVSELPYEMAQGHLRGIVKEEKNRFFGHFLWGLGQLKDTLEVNRKRRLDLEKEKKKMLLSLSHDIKTPLSTIKLYGKALEENLYEEESQKIRAARQIGQKAEEIERFVEEIMKNSREDILDIQVEPGEFYLSRLMEQVLATYEEKCRIRMVDLEVGSFEDRLLKGDLQRAAEVFENIFENAFKYGDGRRIEISFSEEDYCQLIRIFNTGTPVTDNDFNHIFESFFRGAGSEGIQGSGLGLYICREIMRKMDGEIFARKEAEGMAFVLVFR